MNKNKLIAFIIWAVTLLLPFNFGFMISPEPNMISLITFLATLTGMGVGAWFFSKKTKNGNSQASA